MKTIFPFLYRALAIYICILPVSLSAQIVLTGGLSGSDLADIIAGEGVSITNVTLNCPGVSSGSFMDGNTTNLGVDEGVVLTSGRLSDIPGPNLAENTSFDNGAGGDADLTAASGFTTFNACVLEFDFVPSANGLMVKYVFASEEYNEYVCSQFNDVFAFYVTGPNPSGPDYVNQDIALVPGVGSPVTINSINIGAPGGFADGSPCDLGNSALYVNNPVGSPSIEYDGFTAVLKAELALVPCSTYHFKFAIADASDEILDSGVFIESASFETNNIVASTTDSPEGCPGGEITFTTTLPTTVDYTIDITVLGSSTASPTDYEPFTLSHMLLAGQTSITVPIVSIADILDEGDETIDFEFTYDAGCDPTTDFGSAMIIDGPITCMDALITLDGDGTRTITPDEILTGDLGADCPQFSFDLSQDYFVCSDEGDNIVTVTANDGNGNLSQCNSTVTIVVPPNILSIDLGDPCRYVYFGYEPLACVDITATVTGGTPPYTYDWSNGETTQTITVCPEVTTFYWVTVTDANGCDEVSGFAEVEAIDVRCGKKNDKVLVCHIPPGNPENQHTICVSPNAVPAHFGHGDLYLGYCGDIPCDDTLMLRSASAVIKPYSEVTGEPVLTVYPNPSKQTISLSLNTGAIKEIEIMDVRGNVLFKEQVGIDAGEGYALPTSLRLEPGSYFARVQTVDQQFIVKRFVQL